MKQIYIINGPNLNLLGRREPEIYGSQTFEDYFKILQKKFEKKVELHYYQSNSEGALLDKIHEIGFSADGIIMNAGAYTHTSIALRDAISGVKTPVIEIHISNVHARESFRHHSYLSAVCKGVLFGFGIKGYDLAVESFLIGRV